MAEIINLKQFKKKRERAGKEAKAENNRIQFGRTKAEKQAAKSEQDKKNRSLDEKRLEADGPEASGNPEKGD